jgi:hypothetical protein
MENHDVVAIKLVEKIAPSNGLRLGRNTHVVHDGVCDLLLARS